MRDRFCKITGTYLLSSLKSSLVFGEGEFMNIERWVFLKKMNGRFKGEKPDDSQWNHLACSGHAPGYCPERT